jgi:hypothetical protein
MARAGIRHTQEEMERQPTIAYSVALAVVSAVALGCGDAHPLMPLEPGSATTYVARFGFDARVEPIRIGRRISVAGVEGYELTGPLGVSRLGWREDVLYADQAANAWFSPSLPMLAEDEKPRSWHGRLTAMGRTQPASAKLEHRKAKVEIGSRKIQATLAVLTVKLPTGVLELESWYAPGIGLVQQEQRTNGNRLIQLQMVTAP